MSAAAAASSSDDGADMRAGMAGLAVEEKKDAELAEDEVDDGDSSTDPSASSSLDAVEKKRLANRRKKEKAKQRKAKQSPPAVPSISPAASPSPEMQTFAQSFPSLSMHRFFTDPLQLAFTPSKGRHLLTRERMPRGSTVFTQLPYGAVVCDPLVSSICHRCFVSSNVLLKCSSCSHAHYCSSTCKVAHARLHQHECRVLQALSRQESGDSTAIRLVLRLLSQRHEESALIDKHREKLKGAKKSLSTASSLPSSLQSGSTWSDVLSLQSHMDELSAHDRLSLLSMLSAFVPLFQLLLEKDADDERVDLLLRLLCVIHVNAHHVQNVNKDRLALGLYTAPSLMNHSCAPTCCYFFGEKGEMVMKTIADVPANGELSYSYVDVYQARGRRWETLQQVYKMPQCDCARCSEPEDQSFDRRIAGLQCNQCREGQVTVQAGEGRCELCNRTFSAANLKEAEDDAELLCQKALSLYSTEQHAMVASTCREKLMAPSAASALLRPHPFSFPAFQAYFMLLPSLSALGEHGEVAVFAGLARECLERAGLRGHPEYADVLVVEGEALGKQGRGEEGRALLEKAKGERERLYGKKHVLTKDAQLKLNRLS